MSDEPYTGPEEVPVVDGSIAGGLAYCLGYLLTLIPVALFETEGVIAGVVDKTGWVYYNAQFVEITPRATPDGSVTLDIPAVNYVTGSGLEEIGAATLTVPPTVYHAIPVAVFLASGFVLALSLGATSPRKGAIVGASVVLGGVLAALGGTFIFEVGNRMGPSRPQSVLFAGIVYPVVCGGTGGVLATVARNLRGEEADSSKPF